MADKLATPKSGACSVDYKQDTRTLEIVWRDGTVQSFYGVPPELTYGIPTGLNLMAFVEHKLTGRFVQTVTMPPPVIGAQMVSGTLSVIHKGITFEYKLPTKLLSSLPDEPNQKFKWFQQHVIAKNISPERTFGLDDAETDEATEAKGSVGLY